MPRNESVLYKLSKRRRQSQEDYDVIKLIKLYHVHTRKITAHFNFILK